MKIDAQLRNAIRNVLRQRRGSITHHRIQVLETAAAQQFMQTCPVAYATYVEVEEAQAHLARQIANLHAFGLDEHGRIHDADTFRQSGGHYPDELSQPTESELLAQLALATPQAGRDIIRKLGIDWS